MLLVSGRAAPVGRRAFFAADRLDDVEVMEASDESLGTRFSVGLRGALGAPFIRDAATPGPGRDICAIGMRRGGFMEFNCPCTFTDRAAAAAARALGVIVADVGGGIDAFKEGSPDGACWAACRSTTRPASLHFTNKVINLE